MPINYIRSALSEEYERTIKPFGKMAKTFITHPINYAKHLKETGEENLACFMGILEVPLLTLGTLVLTRNPQISATIGGLDGLIRYYQLSQLPIKK